MSGSLARADSYSACSHTLSEPAYAALTALVGWLARKQAYLAPGLRFSCRTVGGIEAAAELEQGEVVASVPLSLLITQDSALAEDPQLSGLSGTNLMALFLLLVMFI